MKTFRCFLTCALLTTSAVAQAAPPVHPPAEAATGVHMANGIKTGEVTSTSAVLWARLTKMPERNANGTAFAKAPHTERQWPAGQSLNDMEGAVEGAVGEVRVHYSIEATSKPIVTPWQAVQASSNFSHKFQLTDLVPASTYRVLVEGRAGTQSAVSGSLEGHFRTAPTAEQRAAVSFCVITGQDYARRDDKANGHLIYGHMLALAPDFLVHTGDTIYYDKPRPFATTVELARFKWDRLYGLSLPRAFHRQVSCYFLKDDHDTLKNDCWPGQRYGELTWRRGLELYKEQLPVNEPPYRRVRWGKELEIWLMAGREFRSANRDADGPDKTIWGAAQKQWLKTTLSASTATFRVLISPTPIVGPDRLNKNDNHANRGFAHEGNEVRAFLAKQRNTIVICGDRHWQYVSQDPQTGLREWSCGPTSNAHAGGFRKRNQSEMHQYLNVCGGFLHVDLQTTGDGSQLVLRHHGTDGEVLHEDVLRSK